MNNIDVANGIVFQKLGIKKDTFDDRLICQKKLYLLQELGTDLGYTYNWYVRGPYSPALTNYVYNNLEVLACTDFSQYKLSGTAERNMNSVNELLNDKTEDMSESEWYELLASLLYIEKNKQSWNIDDEDSSLIAELIKYKPQYDQKKCEHALNVLRTKKYM